MLNKSLGFFGKYLSDNLDKVEFEAKKKTTRKFAHRNLNL